MDQFLMWIDLDLSMIVYLQGPVVPSEEEQGSSFEFAHESNFKGNL